MARLKTRTSTSPRSAALRNFPRAAPSTRCPASWRASAASARSRHIFGVVAARPELGRAGVGLRRFGQNIIELLGKKRIHPGWVVPGGVTEPLEAFKRDEILASIPEAYKNVTLALDAYKKIADSFRAEIEVFANFPSNYLSLVNEDDSIEFTDGTLRLIGSQGGVIEDGITAARFTEVIGEAARLP